MRVNCITRTKPLVQNMGFKPLLGSSGVKAFVGFLLVFCILQLISNNEEIKSTNYNSNTADKDYRKRFNLLMDGPEEIGEECTLGNVCCKQINNSIKTSFIAFTCRLHK